MTRTRTCMHMNPSPSPSPPSLIHAPTHAAEEERLDKWIAQKDGVDNIVNNPALRKAFESRVVPGSTCMGLAGDRVCKVVVGGENGEALTSRPRHSHALQSSSKGRRPSRSACWAT